MTQADILQTLTAFKANKSSEYGIQALGVFGSMARGQAHSESDLDVVIRLDKQDLFNLIGIKQDLEEQLGVAVDVVSYREKMNDYLKSKIEEEALYA